MDGDLALLRRHSVLLRLIIDRLEFRHTFYPGILRLRRVIFKRRPAEIAELIVVLVFIVAVRTNFHSNSLPLINFASSRHYGAKTLNAGTFLRIQYTTMTAVSITAVLCDILTGLSFIFGNTIRKYSCASTNRHGIPRIGSKIL